LKEAKSAEVQVIPEDFFTNLTLSSKRDEVLSDIQNKNIASWGADVRT
jgi:hypothetical protein